MRKLSLSHTAKQSGSIRLQLSGVAYAPAIGGPASFVEVRLETGDAAYCGRFEPPASVFPLNDAARVWSNGPSMPCDDSRHEGPIARHRTFEAGLHLGADLLLQGAARRSIVNHAEMQAAIAELVRPGLRFRNVQLERMDFAEQVATFAQAALVIGQHGAGLANAAWMRRGQAVVELSDRSPAHFLRLSRALGHRFARHEIGAAHATVDVVRLVAWLRAQPGLREFLA